MARERERESPISRRVTRPRIHLPRFTIFPLFPLPPPFSLSLLPHFPPSVFAHMEKREEREMHMAVFASSDAKRNIAHATLDRPSIAVRDARSRSRSREESTLVTKAREGRRGA